MKTMLATHRSAVRNGYRAKSVALDSQLLDTFTRKLHASGRAFVLDAESVYFQQFFADQFQISEFLLRGAQGYISITNARVSR